MSTAFEQKFQERHARTETYWATAKDRQADLNRDLESLFKRLFPKRKKYNFDAIKDSPETAELIATHQASANLIIEEHKQYSAAADKELERLAQLDDIPTTPELHVRHVSHASTYSTVGFGASSYAKNAAQMQADIALHHGLQAEVRPHGEARRYDAITYQDYAVHVNTTEIGWEMLKRRPGLSLKETLKACWKRGVNPRVYNPFLPPGIEEKLGIDYFGNETT